MTERAWLGSRSAGLPQSRKDFTARAIVALSALFGGPLTGASMTPARLLGPAVLGTR